MTANTFGIHISTVSKIIKEMCSAISYKLLEPTYVKSPQTEEEMIEKAAEFVSKYGMHQAFGCIIFLFWDHLSNNNNNINNSINNISYGDMTG